MVEGEDRSHIESVAAELSGIIKKAIGS
jgi:hypothetical protein